MEGWLTDVDISELGQALAELLDLGLVGLDLVAVGIDALALLLDMEAQVLQEDHVTLAGIVDQLLHFRAHRVGGNGDFLSQKLLQLWHYGLEAVLGVHLPIRASQVGHEDDHLGAVVKSILDGGDSTRNALRVGYLLVLVEGDVEVDADQNPLVVEVNVLDGELVGDGHGC